MSAGREHPDGRRPLHVPPALVDGRVLLVAALVASPAAYRATQGLLSVSEAMTRYLLVALGCVVVSVVVRMLWPVLAGEDPAVAAAAAAAATTLDATQVLDPAGPLDPMGSLETFDEGNAEGFGGFGAFGSLDDLDSLELTSD